MALPVASPGEITGLAELQGLRSRAYSGDAAARGEVAVQFEALVYELMLKSAREAMSGDDIMGGASAQQYLEIMDRQVALALARQGGLGLGKLLGVDPAAKVSERPQDSAPIDHASFVREIAPYARAAGASLGVDPKLLVAQAALESGWGGASIRKSDGQSSFNLFGIKAGNRWSGETVARNTLEYVDGIARRRVEHFRTYPDLEAGFGDYVELIRNSSRYSDAVAEPRSASDYVQALVDGGYATDPNYGEKWLSVYHGPRLEHAYSAGT